MDDRLIEASQQGDIDVLYELIREDAHVLRRIDEIVFVDTPLHIAASSGHASFVMEMMNLMPSFSQKLNKSGLSPMHLAMLNGNLELVLSFLELDCDLVRVKGRGGLTPLHLAVKYGNIDLLASFLVACPKSIEDLSVHGETALHIAVKYNMLEALAVLVGWLQRVCHEDALKWRVKIPNRKDDQGKTVLDIAASNNQLEFIKLLSEINAQNSKGRRLTASSTIQHKVKLFWRRMAKKMRYCGRNRDLLKASSPESRKTLTNYLRSKTSFDEKLAVFITRHKLKISDDARSALLVVVGLLVAATFPAIFSPPGSVRQGDNENPSTVTVTNSTASGRPPLAGTVVMDSGTFLYFSMYNSGVLHAAVCLTGLLLPDGFLGAISMILLLVLLSCYDVSIQIISPDDGVVRMVDSLLLTSMYMTVVFVLAMHEGGKRKLRRLCYGTD
ncbi:ankyrin repeat-containing protein BDA1-like [Herrania umbratica]|uniref:Ankyrin repeat-containing protein BDA1-like n=1 Tax=Herrania umbratica TaxID=108875 RepID=A0A6J1BKH1_9ROSI|nr:ankyrin repeat-containing protein BDA1-like [Herrania umbratica]